jgi:GNAT superfamily N-acetyltransferase
MAGEKFKVFDAEGKSLGAFDTIADAGRAAQRHFNESFDKSVEGKDAPVPPTEVPPSRVGYIDREFGKLTDNFVGGKEKFLENTNVLIDRILASPDGLYPKEAKLELIKIRKSIEETGSIKLSELRDLQRLEKINRVHDMKRLPYYNYDYFMELIDNLLGKNFDKIGSQYDNMYPMEIKSALHPRLAQIFQDYPNLTAQGLLKKLVVYGSQGNRMFQEATEIGLVDLLKSKIQKTTSLMRADASEAVRGTPEMSAFLGNIISVPRGGETQPKLNMQEILDFAKAKEIKVTIEEGARERSGIDTSKYTLGGAKANYKETAVRINPEYAHGISGHYGKDTIVHFRTTERIDADGNRHLFIEEVQANNTDIKSGLSQQEIKDIEIDRDVHLPIYKEILAEGKRRGRFVSDEADGYTSQKDGVIDYVFQDVWQNGYADEIINGIALDWSYRLHQIGSTHIAEQWVRTKVPAALKQLYHEIERGLRTKEFKDSTSHFFEILKDEFRVENKGKDKNDYIQFCKDISETTEVQKLIDLVSKDAVQEEKWRKYLYDIDQVKNQGYVTYQVYTDKPYRLLERIADVETSVQQLNQQKTSKPLPLTSAKDWTLTALKGIIRQAIRDGLDKITLTHPDDSPTVSHMAGDARRGLYGKLIPEVWGSWLRKYGIEIKQTNKLADATIDTAKGQMAEITNKLHDANKAVLEHFEQVKGGEDATLIQNVAELLAMPVHMADPTIHLKIEKIASRLNDNKLIGLINEVALLKGAEFNAYERINKLREGGVRGDSTLKSDTDAGISAEAIDRGMTFELNDRLKRDFLDGKIQTHMMPAEGGADSVATKNKITLDTNGVLSKLGMNLKDKTKMEIWMRHLTDDPATALEFIREEGLVGWMKNRAQSVIDAEVESWDTGYKELKHQQKVAQQFLDKVESGNIDTTNFMPSEGGAEGGRTYTPEQMSGKFIGRIAAENPELTKYKKVLFTKDTEKGKLGEDTYRLTIKPKDEVASEVKVGYINVEINGTDASVEYVKVNPRWEGEGYGKLLYSEMVERLRSLGVKEFSGMIVDESGRPQKIRKRIIDQENTRIGETDDTTLGRTRRDKYGDTQTDVTSYLKEKARYMPEEGEEPIRLSGKKKTISTKKVSTNQYEMGEGNRTYDTDSRQWTNGFIGRYAEENPILTKGLKLSMKNWDKRTDDYGKRSIELKEGNKLIGRIDYEVKKGSGGKWLLSDPAVRVWEQYRGKGYSNLLYSEMAERARFLGAEDFLQRIENDLALPMYAQVNTFGFGESKLIDATLGQYFPPTKENFDKLKKPLIEIQKQDGNVETMEGYEPWVHSWSKIFSDRHYMPAEGDDYRGSHKAPSGENGEGSLDAMDRTYPEDLYSAQGARFYGDGQPKLDKQMHDIVMRLRGKPDAMITVYRAVPKGVSASINKGDWVTPLKAYAFMHGERWNEGADIIEKKVKASELFTEGNSLYEFGWSPKEITEAEKLQAEIDSDKNWLERVRKQNPVFSTKPNTKASRHIDNIERRIRSNERSLEKLNKPKFQPAEFTEFKSEQSPTGRILRNARGYVIMLANNKFRVYNPSKAIIGVYTDEEQAKKRIYKEIPKR